MYDIIEIVLSITSSLHHAPPLLGCLSLSSFGLAAGERSEAVHNDFGFFSELFPDNPFLGSYLDDVYCQLVGKGLIKERTTKVSTGDHFRYILQQRSKPSTNVITEL